MKKLVAVVLIFFLYVVGAGATHGMMRMLVPVSADRWEEEYDNTATRLVVSVLWPVALPSYFLYRVSTKIGKTISDKLQP